MFKFGIYKISQLTNKNANQKKKNVAINLYPEIEKTNIINKDKIEELILERFSFSNGTYKRTHNNRFPTFDDYIIKYLNKNYNSSDNLKIHDIAISDGRTSLDFYKKLKENFKNISFYGSDKESEVFIYSSKKKQKNKIVKDSEGNILQIILPPFVLNQYTPKMAKLYKVKKTILYPINFFLLHIIKIPFFQNLLIPIDTENPQKLRLFNHEIQNQENENKNFHLINYNLLDKSPEKFDIIRVMNVINPTYFNKKEIKRIVNNLHLALKENGILIIGSNKKAGSNVNGNIFLKENNLFSEIKQFGTGINFKEKFKKTKT